MLHIDAKIPACSRMAGIFRVVAAASASRRTQPVNYMPNLALASFWQVSLAAPAMASQRSLAAL